MIAYKYSKYSALLKQDPVNYVYQHKMLKYQKELSTLKTMQNGGTEYEQRRTGGMPPPHPPPPPSPPPPRPAPSPRPTQEDNKYNTLFGNPDVELGKWNNSKIINNEKYTNIKKSYSFTNPYVVNAMMNISNIKKHAEYMRNVWSAISNALMFVGFKNTISEITENAEKVLAICIWLNNMRNKMQTDDISILDKCNHFVYNYSDNRSNERMYEYTYMKNLEKVLSEKIKSLNKIIGSINSISSIYYSFNLCELPRSYNTITYN